MEQGREKKTPQAIPNNLMQQKVFKFHNVSKDIILGNKKAKKDAKKKAKSVSSHVISMPEDDSKEKMAHLIFKQFIPIRKKYLPVELIQTKSNKEKESTTMAKKSFLTSCSKSLQFEINKKESSKIQEIQSMSEPTDDKANQTEKPSFIRVVDISSLKEPSHNSGNNLFAKNTVSDQTLSTIFKCNSLDSMHHLDDTSTHLSRMVFPNDEEEAPLDLSKKGQPPEPPNKEQYPLDLSNKYKKFDYRSVGEPPPLMPIHIIPKNSLNTFSPDMSTPNNLKNSSELVENSVEAQSNDQTNAVNYSNNPSLNKENLVIPPILNLQPIQLVFTTNPVLHVMQTQTVCKETIINTNKPSPAIQNVPTDFTTELIRTKLREKSMNNPTPETHINEVTNPQSNTLQPIQMVFTGGQFLQVLPSQNIQENVQPVCENLNTNIAPTKTDEIKIVKTRKKKITAGEPKGSLTTLLQVSKQNIHQNERLKNEHINEKSHQHKNKGNKKDTTKDLNQNLLVQNTCKTRMLENASLQSPSSNSSMIQTNETVTSNGGVFCTFKNVKRMKMIKMETKTRRKKSKPDQSNVMNTNV